MREMTAVVCSHDLIATSFLRALRDLGILVPEEVSVVGFDDVQWASIVNPSLTTVDSHTRPLADEASKLLLERIDKPDRKARHLKLGVQLVERESVARARNIVQRRGTRRSGGVCRNQFAPTSGYTFVAAFLRRAEDGYLLAYESRPTDAANRSWHLAAKRGRSGGGCRHRD